MTDGRFYDARVDEERMVHSDDATGRSHQVVSPGPPITRRRVTALAALPGQLERWLGYSWWRSCPPGVVALGPADRFHAEWPASVSLSVRARVFTTAWRVAVVEE
jgi:hypothetical protein